MNHGPVPNLPSTIGTLYDGTTLTVAGTAPSNCEVVVRFMGAPEELHMKEKGKAFNLLWMNTGSVTFEAAPKAYLVASSKPLKELVGPKSAELGLADMAERIEVSGTKDDRATLMGDLLALKGREGLYAEQSGAVTYGPDQGGTRTYTAGLRLPAKLAPGSYTVQAMALLEGYEDGPLRTADHGPPDRRPGHGTGEPGLRARRAVRRSGHLGGPGGGPGRGSGLPEQGSSLGGGGDMDLLAGLRGLKARRRLRKQPVSFAMLYKKFTDILERNNRILELMADMGDKLGGEYVFDGQYVITVCEALNDMVFKLITDLSVLTDHKHMELFSVFEGLQHDIREELAGRHAFPRTKPALALDEMGDDQAEEAGGKMAALAVVRNILGLPTPDGFVITTKSFQDYMRHNGLPEFIRSGLTAWDGRDEEAFNTLSKDVRRRIMAGSVPRPVARYVASMLDILAQRQAGRDLRLAVRSSAWDEGGRFSFAGQYESVINVAPGDVLDAYKRVLAGAYSPEAWRYRLHRGYLEPEVAMAVGCQTLRPAVVGGGHVHLRPPGPGQRAHLHQRGLGPGRPGGGRDSGNGHLRPGAHAALRAGLLRRGKQGTQAGPGR